MKIDRCDIDLHANTMVGANHDFIHIFQQISWQAIWRNVGVQILLKSFTGSVVWWASK